MATTVSPGPSTGQAVVLPQRRSVTIIDRPKKPAAPSAPVFQFPDITFPDFKFPEPTAEERELLSLQLADLRSRREEEAAFRQAFESLTGMPYSRWLAGQSQRQASLFEAEQADLMRALAARQRASESFRERVGMAPEEAEAEGAMRDLEFQRIQHQRFLDAVEGKLPVSPGLERGLGEQERQLRESLRRANLDETSTPGIQALAEFRQRSEELRDAARRGVLTETEQFALGESPVTRRVATAQIQGGPAGSALALSPLFEPQTERTMFGLQQQLGQERARQGEAAGLSYRARTGLTELAARLMAGQQAQQAQFSFLSTQSALDRQQRAQLAAQQSSQQNAAAWAQTAGQWLYPVWNYYWSR